MHDEYKSSMQKNLNKNKKAGNKRKTNLTTSKKRSQNQTKKGALSKPVRKQGLKRQATEEVKITKIINAQNEGNFAGVAQNAGGKLSVLKVGVRAGRPAMPADDARRRRALRSSSALIHSLTRSFVCSLRRRSTLTQGARALARARSLARLGSSRVMSTIFHFFWTRFFWIKYVIQMVMRNGLQGSVPGALGDLEEVGDVLLRGALLDPVSEVHDVPAVGEDGSISERARGRGGERASAESKRQSQSRT